MDVCCVDKRQCKKTRTRGTKSICDELIRGLSGKI